MKLERLGGIMNKQLLNIQMFAEVKDKLFKANLQDLIKKFTVDDVFNGEEALTELNTQINKFNSKNQPKVETFKVQAKEEVIKELGIETVTNENQLKAHIASLSSNETAQNLTTALAKVTELEGLNKDLTGKYTDASGKIVGFENKTFLMGKGVNPDFIDFLTDRIGKDVSEETDFSKAYETYATSNPQYFTTAPEVKAPITTNKPHVVASQGKEVSSVEQILIDKGRLQQT
jgi:pyridoxine 5'-phosphate synthase PdxJ